MKDEQLFAFVADARAQTAAAARRRTRWLHQQLREDVGMARLCEDLARDRAPVELFLTGGRTCRGHMIAAVKDLVLLADPDGATYVSAHAIAGLRVLARAVDQDAPVSDVAEAAPTLRATHVLADVLADLVGEHVEVHVGTREQVHVGAIGGVARDFVWFGDNARCVRIDAIIDVRTWSRQ